MALIGQVVSEEKIFEIVDDGQMTDGRWTPDHGHPISSPCEPNGSGELKTETECSKTKMVYRRRTRKCVYETLCPQLVSHFQDVKMSKK